MVKLGHNIYTTTDIYISFPLTRKTARVLLIPHLPSPLETLYVHMYTYLTEHHEAETALGFILAAFFGLVFFTGIRKLFIWRSWCELNDDLLLDLLVGSLLEDKAIGLLLHILNEVGTLGAQQ